MNSDSRDIIISHIPIYFIQPRIGVVCVRKETHTSSCPVNGRFGAFFLLLALLSGCMGGGVKDQFYMLESSGIGSSPSVFGKAGPRIGLGPVKIPAYLDRPQIVTSGAGHEYHLSDTHRWAERLDENIARVLSEDLARLVPTDRVSVYPWPRDARLDAQVSLQIQEFHADISGTARLIALWTVRPSHAESIGKRFECTMPFAGDDYVRIVEAENKCLERLGLELAAVVRSLKFDAPEGDKSK